MKIIYQDFCDNGEQIVYLHCGDVVVINSSLPQEKKNELEERFSGTSQRDAYNEHSFTQQP